jgi:RNA polymerase sigma-70 factor (ECF subfamily)
MDFVASRTDDLIRQAATGDQLAFKGLVRPHLRPAFQLAVTMLGEPEAAEDAVQEATLKAWRHLHRLRAGTSFRSWFLTVVANQCRSERRTAWWRVLRGLERLDTPQATGPEVLDWDLEQALLSLSMDERAAVFLRFYEDLPLQELARIQGISVSGTHSRIRRALERMRLRIDLEVDR